MNDDQHSIFTRFRGLISGILSVGKSGGYSVLKIVLLVDERGYPVIYPSILFKRISPMRQGKEKIDLILSSFMDEDDGSGWMRNGSDE